MSLGETSLALKQSNNRDINGGRKRRSALNQDEECRGKREIERVHGHDHGVVERIQQASLDFDLGETCSRSITSVKLEVTTSESWIISFVNSKGHKPASSHHQTQRRSPNQSRRGTDDGRGGGWSSVLEGSRSERSRIEIEIVTGEAVIVMVAGEGKSPNGSGDMPAEGDELRRRWRRSDGGLS
ncbi:hypothetical protein NL676_028592 [Syzygium grande]|nr:hypothetical protein NL676_028592 [Syzygium grande]